MFKLFLVALAFVVERYQTTQISTSSALVEKLVRQRKRIALAALAGSAGVIIFSAGVVICFVDLSSQYDRLGGVVFSATLLAGLILALVPAAIFGTVWGLDWVQAARRRKKLAASPSNPWRQLANLIIADLQRSLDQRSQRQRLSRASVSRQSVSPTYASDSI